MKLRILAPASAVIVADQASKAWMSAALAGGRSIPVLPGLAWELTHNDGAAFGMLEGNNLKLIVASVVAVAMIIAWARHATTSSMRGALGLLLGGAIGNLIDRARLGHVVDFIAIQRGGQTIFPNFNVADSAISIGACLLAYSWYQYETVRASASLTDPSQAGLTAQVSSVHPSQQSVSHTPTSPSGVLPHSPSPSPPCGEGK